MSKTTFNLRIDAELKAKFSQALGETGETATAVIVRAIEAYCEEVSQNSNDNTTVNSNASVTKDNGDNSKTFTREEIEAIIEDRVTARLETYQDNLVYLVEQTIKEHQPSQIDKDYPTERLLKLIQENDARISKLENTVTDLIKNQKQLESKVKEQRHEIDKLWLAKASMNHWRTTEAKLDEITQRLDKLEETKTASTVSTSDRSDQNDLPTEETSTAPTVSTGEETKTASTASTVSTSNLSRARDLPTEETSTASTVSTGTTGNNKECQVYLVQLKNEDKKPTKLERGIDFSCETDDTTDLMEAISDYLYNNDLIDPDDEDLNIRVWDNSQDWIKANRGRGVTMPKMAKKIGMARNTLAACMDDQASDEKQEIYEKEVTPDYYWCYLTHRFYRR